MKADTWAIGVILYIFITGKMPFDESRGNAGVLEEQRRLEFPWRKYKKVTPDERGKDLARGNALGEHAQDEH
jgi:serine kinase